MGHSSSCLPISISTCHSLCHHNSVSKWIDDHQEQINNNPIDINHVSEDELLFLPGITRHLAENIIEYRQKNNGFEHINEVLQVSEITSDIFRKIYTDIAIDSSPNSTLNIKKELTNLNLASYNELCLVVGLTPNLVTRIIQHRERKGFFRSTGDLRKIKGIDSAALATIRPYVTVDRQQSQSFVGDCSLKSIYSKSLNRNYNKENDTLSLLSDTLPSELQTTLLSSLPSRPSVVPNNNNSNKQNTFRFASWNLQQITNDKVKNPGVRQVICRVILENNFSLIGIQEIRNKEVLDSIIQELNNPTIPLIKNWPKELHGKWKFTISDVSAEIFQGSEYLGFLYDESIGIELKKASLLPFKTYFTHLPYIATFRIFNKFELVFVNIHLKTKTLDEDDSEERKDATESLSVLAQAMKNTIVQKHVIIFGSFNDIPTASEFEALVKCNYSYVIQQNRNISLEVPQGSICIDNIWLSEEAKKLSSGNPGVIRDNLRSIWIPTGWTWGSLVCNHCPIWMEFDLS